jgi:hypothetical protein
MGARVSAGGKTMLAAILRMVNAACRPHWRQERRSAILASSASSVSSGGTLRHRERAPQERTCLGEGELVDDIHEEQGHRARVGGAPVEAATLSPSVWGPHATGAFFGSPS